MQAFQIEKIVRTIIILYTANSTILSGIVAFGVDES
jgi:hypothetical protein